MHDRYDRRYTECPDAITWVGEKVMNKMKSFAMVPVMVIAGILAVHMMFAIAYIAPAVPMA